jgi:hypothetical protein
VRRTESRGIFTHHAAQSSGHANCWEAGGCGRVRMSRCIAWPCIPSWEWATASIATSIAIQLGRRRSASCLLPGRAIHMGSAGTKLRSSLRWMLTYGTGHEATATKKTTYPISSSRLPTFGRCRRHGIINGEELLFTTRSGLEPMASGVREACIQLPHFTKENIYLVEEIWQCDRERWALRFCTNRVELSPSKPAVLGNDATAVDIS